MVATTLLHLLALPFYTARLKPSHVCSVSCFWPKRRPHLAFVHAQPLLCHSPRPPPPHITQCCHFAWHTRNTPFRALVLGLGVSCQIPAPTLWNPQAGTLTFLFTTVAGPRNSEPPMYAPFTHLRTQSEPSRLALAMRYQIPAPALWNPPASPSPFCLPPWQVPATPTHLHTSPLPTSEFSCSALGVRCQIPAPAL